MKILESVDRQIVIDHWRSQDDRVWDIVEKELQPEWFLAEIELKDIPEIYIIFTGDWSLDHSLAVNNDFRLYSIHRNFLKLIYTENERVKEIVVRKKAFTNLNDSIDRTLFLVSEGINSEQFTLMEGNRRAIALLDLRQLVGQLIYLGIYSVEKKCGFIPPKMR